MRHRVQDKKFNRDTNQRKALFMGLLRNLTEHGEIVTTVAKAKELRRLTDKVMTIAKQNSVIARRELHTIFGKRDVVNTLVDVIAPAMADRNSGYTSLEKIGPRRGDNTPMAKIAFMTNKATGSLKKPKSAEAKEAKKTAKVAKPKAVKAEAKTAETTAAKKAAKPAAAKKAVKAKTTKEVK